MWRYFGKWEILTDSVNTETFLPDVAGQILVQHLLLSSFQKTFVKFLKIGNNLNFWNFLETLIVLFCLSSLHFLRLPECCINLLSARLEEHVLKNMNSKDERKNVKVGQGIGLNNNFMRTQKQSNCPTCRFIWFQTRCNSSSHIALVQFQVVVKELALCPCRGWQFCDQSCHTGPRLPSLCNK